MLKPKSADNRSAIANNLAMGAFPTPMVPSNNKSEQNNIKWVVAGVVLVLIIIITVVNLLMFTQTLNNKQSTATQDKSNEEVATEVIDAFKKVFEVPEGENPTITVITDADKLRQQEPTFYKNAKNGDNVVILFSTKLAVLFRKNEERIINVAPINLQDQSSDNKSTPKK